MYLLYILYIFKIYALIKYMKISKLLITLSKCISHNTCCVSVEPRHHDTDELIIRIPSNMVNLFTEFIDAHFPRGEAYEIKEQIKISPVPSDN